MKTIEKILELNKNRTQGDWLVGDGDRCDYYPVYTAEGYLVDWSLKYEPEELCGFTIENAEFIAAAPDMAYLIKKLQQERDDYKEALEFYAIGGAGRLIAMGGKGNIPFTFPDYGDTAQQALNKHRGKDND